MESKKLTSSDWTTFWVAFLVLATQQACTNALFGDGTVLNSCVQDGTIQGNLALALLSGDCDVGISVSGTGNTISTVSVDPDGDGYVYDYDYDDDDDSSGLFILGAPDDATVPPSDEGSVTDAPAGPGADGRPVGNWDIIVAGHVRMTPGEVWELTPNFGKVLIYGFGDLAASVLAKDDDFKKWVVELESGENLETEVIETNKEHFYHVATILEHGSDIFPGIDVQGSKLFFQAADGEPKGTAKLEIGWNGRLQTIGNRDDANIIIRSLFLEMIARLEDKFGGNCESARARRTIEGRCNNLRTPTLGAAGQPLRRLETGNGKDLTTGPRGISPRLISNMLFAQSPGASVLNERLETVSNECLKATNKGITWEVCPYQRAKATRGREVVFLLEWQGTETNDDKMVAMKFADDSGNCNFRVVFTCDGQERLNLGKNPCGSTSNQFLHPNACMIQPGNDNVLTNSNQLSDLFWSMGQFVDHDLDLTPTEEIAEGKKPGFRNSRVKKAEDEFPIAVPRKDFFFSNSTMEFQRARFSSNPDVKSHLNQHSGFADLGQVYGVDILRANALRSFKDGKLKMGSDNLLPLNKIEGDNALGAKLGNEPNATNEFYAAGDVRANEQPLLLSLHTLWALEHNLVCEELKDAFPNWSDEQLYQMARSIVISEYQSILWAEWLPLLLGPNAVHPEEYAYDIEIDPTINAVFSTVAFRFGHSMVGSYLWKQGPGPRGSADLELLPLREVFFRPALITNAGIDDFLRGGAWHLAQEVDVKVVDELRNFLFADNPEEAHMDLVALNIQRGRDMGMPSFNQLRKEYGLPKYKHFSEISQDERIYHILKQVYHGDIDKVDPFVGGLAEKHVEGSQLGPTFHAIIKDQFTKMRDGDRFFYKGIQWDHTMLESYPRLEQIVADEVRLADIVFRNTDVTPAELGIGPRETAFQL